MPWERVFDLSEREGRLKELEHTILAPDFWDRPDRAQALLKERAALASELEARGLLKRSIEDLEALVELCSEDESLCEELVLEVDSVDAKLRSFELEKMLSGPHDGEAAIVELNSGAGGTEAQDWGEMLLRMYLRWAERRGFRTEILSFHPGDEAGLKSATLSVQGDNAFGFLRSERGVHRLVRISPFDSNARRHTSFASVSVMPDVEEELEVEVDEEELRVDTYRSSGAGGQHVNKTDSAVRITHIPTGLVASCQSGRSQHQNKATAMRLLKAKLYDRQMEAKRLEMEQIAGEKKRIDFGSQIRSYVMQPYRLVKDLRTGVEFSDIHSALDGNIDRFIEAYLLSEELNHCE